MPRPPVLPSAEAGDKGGRGGGQTTGPRRRRTGEAVGEW